MFCSSIDKLAESQATPTKLTSYTPSSILSSDIRPPLRPRWPSLADSAASISLSTRVASVLELFSLHNPQSRLFNNLIRNTDNVLVAHLCQHTKLT